jgi:hypothetical protein
MARRLLLIILTGLHRTRADAFLAFTVATVIFTASLVKSWFTLLIVRGCFRRFYL